MHGALRLLRLLRRSRTGRQNVTIPGLDSANNEEDRIIGSLQS